MRHADHKPLYRHTGVALLRAAATPLSSAPDQWPDLTDIASCRAWLDQMWARDGLAAAVRQASPSLADRVDAIRAGHTMSDKQLRSATVSAVRYVLRSIGRPTPFGLFAGVAPVTLAAVGRVELRAGHRAAARVDAQWLADIITRAEACPQLLERLYVTANDLTVRRDDRLELPQGTDRARVLCTSAILTAWQAAATPMRFGDLIDKLANDFTTDRLKVRDSITALLVRPGFLLTSLRAPFTVTDPFTHVMTVLHDANAAELPEIADLLGELDAVHAKLRHHNAHTTSGAEQHEARAALINHMRTLSPAGRTPIAADLLLDNTVELPIKVAQEMAAAASALLRTTRHPAGDPAWREYQAEFTDRYGVGTLVPLLEVVSPDAGLGYPARFHGSLRSAPAVALGPRDERLLALAWQAMAHGSREIVLSDNDLAALTDPDFDERYIPPHVELAARVHCASVDALNRDEFTLTVAPARSAGTLTSRFTPMATGSGLAEAYRALPAATEGALRAQLSFGPKFVPAENVCRVPAYLDHMIPLGEHRGHDDPTTLIPLEDLAVCATRDRLYLVSRSRRRVVEPQVFHALALDKQPHPLARFLAELPRAFSASWYQFDWGPHVTLPVLPRVRYGRTVLSPAQWRLSTTDLPPEGTEPQGWCELLAAWRIRWNCPDVVELRDADRTLRLSLDEPVHATLLHNHLVKHGQAILYEATDVADYGWIDGHAHEIALPLVTTRPAAPSPLHGPLPEVTNQHGQLPGDPGSTWLTAKIHTHPERIDGILTTRLPQLLKALPEGTAWWFVRYHSRHETDHLRLRLRPTAEYYAACTIAVGEWAKRVRQAGLITDVRFASYQPEIGRYGHGAALEAAEDVFATDSQLVAAMLRALPAKSVNATALAVANMVGIVRGLLGTPANAANWLINRAAPAVTIARDILDDAMRISVDQTALRQLPGWTESVEQAWQARAETLTTYRGHLHSGTGVDINSSLESLLHMHHNRAIGINPDHERLCKRLTRHAALAWRAMHQGGDSQ
ncbi:lantibiotic dehydratase [Lentzea jiangxiensis]|uniref:Thiopeptide-type bacteriocin biosynthesis domain-containing protein n=1 Tax=Lentzea jiangxiensis TaxID=641025 RepID=A0A1H0VR03_9PSEU|nr:lantibiotic dehydratase [Lentzea jiangxiensis]SDP80681.1 thiopeptide-type bacteriocin biosynthesis domain-containing protein [Lentzea jiangxiensis]